MNMAECLDRRSRTSGRAPALRLGDLKPPVAEAAIGEVPCAVVTPRPGITAKADELRELARGQAAAHTFPRIVGVVEAFPETFTSKILKREITLEAQA